MKKDIVMLKELDIEGVDGDIIIFNEPVDIKDFQDKVRKQWDVITDKDDYDFEEIYEYIENTFDIKEIIFLDNLTKIYY